MCRILHVAEFVLEIRFLHREIRTFVSYLCMDACYRKTRYDEGNVSWRNQSSRNENHFLGCPLRAVLSGGIKANAVRGISIIRLQS